MESLFEIKYTRDKNVIKEYLHYFYFGNPAMIVLNISFSIIFLFTVASFFYPPIFPINDLKSLYIVIPLSVWTANIIRYSKALRLSEMRDREINNGKPIDMAYIITDEKIEAGSESTETKNSVNLLKVKKAVKTKNLIILITEAKWALVLRKDSFTKGTPDKLLEFLKIKGIKL